MSLVWSTLLKKKKSLFYLQHLYTIIPQMAHSQGKKGTNWSFVPLGVQELVTRAVIY